MAIKNIGTLKINLPMPLSTFYVFYEGANWVSRKLRNQNLWNNASYLKQNVKQYLNASHCLRGKFKNFKVCMRQCKK